MAALMMLLTMGGAPNQLLDYVDTAAYWKAKDVVVSVETMTKELSQTGEDARGRRLMAIRTLGELKDARATETLRKLAQSKAPFEAEYATRAMAEIEGKAYKAPEVTAEALREDVWLLPKGCAIVGQVRMGAGQRVSLAEALAKLPGEMKAEDKTRAGEQLTNMLTKFVEQTGGMRLDGITIGVSGEVSNNAGFVVLIARGEYDRELVAGAIKKAAGKEVTVEVMEGVEVMRIEGGRANLILSEGKRVVLVVGTGRNGEQMTLPVGEMVRALKDGKGGIRDDAEMVKLIEGVGKGGDMFAVMKVTEDYRKAEVLKPFATVVLTTKMAGETLQWEVEARGEDGEGAAKSVKDFEGGRQKMLAAMNEEHGMPAAVKEMFGPFINMVSEIKVGDDGKGTARMTGQLKGKGVGVATMMMMSMGRTTATAAHR